MGYHTTDESAFNMAIAYLQRIDKILYRCQESAIMQDIEGYTANLRAFYRELVIKLKPEEISFFESEFIKIYNVSNDRNKRQIYKQKIMFALDQLDCKLRIKSQEKGFMLPSKDDPRFAVLQR